MSTLGYFKIVRLILLIGLITAAWLTIQGYLPWIPGWIIVFGDAVFVVMIDIRINKYENDL